MTRAVILAGGFGTRLRPLTSTVPKAMIPLVNRPVIDYILDYLVGYGLKDIVITTNYLREQTIEYLTRSRADLTIAYPEEPLPLGTAGSVKNAEIDERMLVIQGDNITEIDIEKLLAFHHAHDGLVTIALLPVPDPSLYGIAELASNGRIQAFKEKPSRDHCFSNLANTGLYILEPEAMAHIPKDTAFDFSKDLFPRLVEKGVVYGCVVDGFWTDVGSLTGYMAASRWILERRGSVCATTAEIEACEILGNVAVGEDVMVRDSIIRGPAVIGHRATVLKSRIHNAVVFPGASVAETKLQNSIVQQNAVIEREEIRDCIR